MAFSDDLRSTVRGIFKDNWSIRDGRKVPSTEDIALGKNDAVRLERATVLYADLRSSTALVDKKKWQFAAEIYKTFLHCAAEIIKKNDGSITAYDGDRIMGVFIGGSQTTSAADSGLMINYAAKKIINEEMSVSWKTDYKLKHSVGIDTSELRVARTGVRGDNDLVWIGSAANYAAKLSEVSGNASTWVTARAYERMNKSTKYSSEGKLMWTSYNWTELDDRTIYGSTWWRKP